MAIRKKVKKGKHSTDTDVTIPAFSYDPSKLAPVIVAIWNDPNPTPTVLARDGQGRPTTAAVNAAKALINTSATDFKLEHPVVITEAEHDDDYTMSDPNEVVFVLPNKPRVLAGANATELLETAKLLMACTPNGI
ncbi:MAG TPA: hypothetical protein VLG74_10645 [Blastocatellia bacterium]|nr:hypothetical protein [Blastocatellia bacterium]